MTTKPSYRTEPFAFLDEEERELLVWRKHTGRSGSRKAAIETERDRLEEAIAALHNKPAAGAPPIDAAELDTLLKALETELQELNEALLVLDAQDADPANCKETKPVQYSAIALSGGGIRSATFALGVLQAFANRELLKFFDCISTVSGGGYIGSSLQWWWNGPHGADNDYGVGPDDFPYGADDPDPKKRGAAGARDKTVQLAHLNYLRRNGNYLIPGSGITLWSGIAILLRALFLNLFVWIPASALCLLVLMYAGSGVLWLEAFLPVDSWTNLSSLPADLRMVASDKAAEQPGQAVAYSVLVIAGSWLVVEFFAASGFYSFFSRIGRGRSSNATEKQAEGSKWLQGLVRAGLISLLTVLLLWLVQWRALPAHQLPQWLNWLPTAIPPIAVPISLLVAAVIIAPFIYMRVHAVEGMTLHYSGRRLFEKRYGKFLKSSAVILVLGTLPIVHGVLHHSVLNVGLVGTISTTAGAVLGLFGHIKSTSKSIGHTPIRLILALGSTLLLYGILMLAYYIAWLVYSSGGFSTELIVFLLVAAVSVASMWVVDTNYISLHRFYRDRLMEAFLPDWSTVADLDERSGPAKAADGFRLSKVWTSQSPGPYPIINTNAVMVNSDNRLLRTWGGDNFALTPIHSGSTATGRLPTSEFNQDRMTLPTAMAISGAAANPNTGVGGKGLSRGRFVSIVMTLLNFRLGYWVVNPMRHLSKAPHPNHLFPGLAYAMFRYGHKRASRYTELSDGGHFENIGLYELVRRQVDLILVCDGEADKSTSYYSFVTVLRRIEDTFGACIHFEAGKGPEYLIPRGEDPNNPRYPAGAEYADRAFFVAEITYASGKRGTIIYLKTTLIDDLSMKAKGYAGAHPTFPDETTADQFFDQEQFEAYRELGFRSGMQAIDALVLERLIVSPLGIRNRDWGIATN